MRWPWQKRSVELSISDPAFATHFGVGPNYAGVTVNETTALGISAVWRAISLISGTIATLPLRTFRETADGQRTRIRSFFDNPGTDAGPTPFAWKETVLLHLLLHGRTYLAHIYNGGGGLIGVIPVHPLAVTVEDPPWTDTNLLAVRRYRVTLANGAIKTYTPDNMTEVLGPCINGRDGMSPIAYGRTSFGTTIAGDRAAAKLFANGAMISGLVTPEEDVDPEEAKTIKDGLTQKMQGWENAGDIAFVNRKLKFSPWTMSAEDAQFLQSRQFQIEEIARWFGVPPFALMQTEKQTSWGTGIESQQRGLGRTVLMPWTMRLEQACSRLLPAPQFLGFDMAGLERATPAEEIRLILEQVRGGLITVNEARRLRGMDPIPGGDELLPPKGTADAPAPDTTEEVAQ